MAHIIWVHIMIKPHKLWAIDSNITAKIVFSLSFDGNNEF